MHQNYLPTCQAGQNDVHFNPHTTRTRSIATVGSHHILSFDQITFYFVNPCWITVHAVFRWPAIFGRLSGNERRNAFFMYLNQYHIYICIQIYIYTYETTLSITIYSVCIFPLEIHTNLQICTWIYPKLPPFRCQTSETRLLEGQP